MGQNQVMPILNQLYAQKKIILEFESAEARENFRQAIYKAKKIQDQHLMDVLDERRETLSFVVKDILVDLDPGEATSYQATMFLRIPKEISYSVISIEDNQVESSGNTEKKIPDNLGESSSKSSPESANPSQVSIGNEEGSQGSLEREKPRC